jgi:hypothetical protein
LFAEVRIEKEKKPTKVFRLVLTNNLHHLGNSISAETLVEYRKEYGYLDMEGYTE